MGNIGSVVGMASGVNPSIYLIQTDDRWVHCPVCDKTWKVHFPSYNKPEKRPDWLQHECGHWNRHEWRGWLYR